MSILERNYVRFAADKNPSLDKICDWFLELEGLLRVKGYSTTGLDIRRKSDSNLVIEHDDSVPENLIDSYMMNKGLKPQ